MDHMSGGKTSRQLWHFWARAQNCNSRILKGQGGDSPNLP